MKDRIGAQARGKRRTDARKTNVVSPTRPEARFCMLCGGKMRRIVEHGAPRRACSKCGFIAYRNPAPACGVLVERAGEILLARRAHEPRREAWGIPAGFMEYGEHPESTAVREALEETGLRVRLTGLFGVYAGRDDPRTRAVLILYKARVVGGRLKAGDDASEVGYFPLDRLPEPIAFHAHVEALDDLKRENGKASRTRAAGAGKRTKGKRS